MKCDAPTAGTDLAAVERAALAVGPGATPEAVADVLGKLEHVKRRVREAEAALRDRMLAWIEENGRDLITGDTRWYAGVRRDTRNVDAAGTLAALMEACEGDLGRVAEHLAAEPFKAGACRGTLPALDFDLLFVTSERAELREGKARKQLLSVNERFAGKGRHHEQV